MKRIGQSLGFVLLSALAMSCSAGGDGTGEEGVDSVSSALCTAATAVPDVPNYTAQPGQVVNWTTTSTCSGSAQYQYWFGSPTGVFTMVRDYSSSPTFAWDTTGLATGRWNLQVFVRDAPTSTYQVVARTTFELDANVACSGITTAMTPAQGIATTQVHIDSTPATCTVPEYQIWHQAPGGSFQVLSAYSAANAHYVWDSTGAAAGNHVFQVFVRAQGSTNTYQAYSSQTYTVLAAAACTGATIAFSPAGSAAIGTAVSVTPSASGCSPAEYEYFYQTPAGGAFKQLSPYTANSPVLWNTNQLAAGTYSFQVFTRAVGSTATYQVVAKATYKLTAATPTNKLIVTGGYQQTCSLLGAGKVGCWGYDIQGEVGNGTATQKVPSPVAVTGITTATSVAAGYEFGCASLSNGSAQCWGYNLHGQLGNGSVTQSSSPVTVTGLSTVNSVAAGNSHACALLTDGTVRCWGYNSRGQLGNGLKSDSSIPVTVAGISTAVQLSGGYYHSCALLADSTVKCWGDNSLGQLGNGTGVSSLTPVTVSGLTGVFSLRSNGSNNCAVRADGTVWCWGANTANGPLGDGTTSTRLAPVQVVGVAHALNVAVGIEHSCAVLQAGTVMCWGYNSFGQLGNGTSGGNSLSPVAVTGLTNVASVGVDSQTTCAALNDKTAQCWGYGVLGSLGNGGVVSSSTPVVVAAVP